MLSTEEIFQHFPTPLPEADDFKIDKDDSQWAEEMPDFAFNVMFRAGTEPAFANKFHDNKEPGIYLSAAALTPLFSSEQKFDSGTGWPSFSAPLAPHLVEEIEDESHGMRRIEVRCARTSAHLGHVFPDGPAPTGLRYCMNSAALVFVPLSDIPAKQ